MGAADAQEEAEKWRRPDREFPYSYQKTSFEVLTNPAGGITMYAIPQKWL
jgi:hypothetical protein